MTFNVILSLVLLIILLSSQFFTAFRYIKKYKNEVDYLEKLRIKKEELLPELRYIALIDSILFSIMFLSISDAYFVGFLLSILAYSTYKVIGYKVDFNKTRFMVILMLFLNGYNIFFIEHTTIVSESMYPKYSIGDFISISKNTYGVRLPVLETEIIKGRDLLIGDTVVFKSPINEREYFVKRVVAKSGDTIEYINKKISVNGIMYKKERIVDSEYGEDVEAYNETDVNGNTYIVLDTNGRNPVYPEQTVGDGFNEICPSYGTLGFRCVVPQGSYFMMGDNRDNSFDSRYFGFIKKEKIVGKSN